MTGTGCQPVAGVRRPNIPRPSIVIDDDIVLIHELGHKKDGAPLRITSRRLGTDDLHRATHNIAGADRCQPSQVLNPGGTKRRGVVQEITRVQPHVHRTGVPTRSDQAPELALFCRLRIDMKRLGVEPASELQDLLLGERVLTQIEGRRLQVLPVEVVTLADPDEVTVAGSVAGSAGVGVVVASVVVTHGLHGRAVLGPTNSGRQTVGPDKQLWSPKWGLVDQVPLRLRLSCVVRRSRSCSTWPGRTVGMSHRPHPASR